MQTLDFNLISERYGWQTTELYHILENELETFQSPCRVWIAGGCIRRAILGQSFSEGDVDFFFENQAGFDALKSFLLDGSPSKEGELRSFRETKIEQENDTNVLISGQLEIPFGDGGTRTAPVKYQLIKINFYKDVAALLDSFDFTLCQFALEITERGAVTLYAGDTALFDTGRKRMVIHRITYPVASTRRLMKYANQGFYACNGCLQQLLTSVVENPAMLNTALKYID